MFEVLFFIPIHDNQGNVFSPALHALFEAKAATLLGGATHIPGEASGFWVGGVGAARRLYRDDLRFYMVAIASIEDGAKVAALARYAKRLYRQEAIGVSYLGLFEVIK